MVHYWPSAVLAKPKSPQRRSPYRGIRKDYENVRNGEKHWSFQEISDPFRRPADRKMPVGGAANFTATKGERLFEYFFWMAEGTG